MNRKVAIPIFIAIMVTMLSFTVVASLNTRITNVINITPMEMTAEKGSEPEFGLRVNVEKLGETEDSDWAIQTIAKLFLIDQVTPLMEPSWKMRLYTATQSVDKTSKVIEESAPYIIVNPETLNSIVVGNMGFNANWWKITIPSTTSQSTVWLKVEVFDRYDPQLYTRLYGTYWFKLNIGSNVSPAYTIDLYAPNIKNKIEPNEVISNKLTVRNDCDYTLYIGIFYELNIKDQYGDNVDKRWWRVDILDAQRTNVYYFTVLPHSYASCYLELTAPSKGDAPPDAAVKIYLDARVLNDTNYGDIEILTTTTSSLFTGEQSSRLGAIGESIMTSNWLYVLILAIIIIIVLIAYAFHRNKRRTRRI